MIKIEFGDSTEKILKAALKNYEHYTKSAAYQALIMAGAHAMIKNPDLDFYIGLDKTKTGDLRKTIIMQDFAINQTDGEK